MERHLLITVSEDQTALFGVRFAASFFTNKEQIRITLLYIAQDEESTDAATTTALEAAASKCVSLGFPADNVDEKSLTKRTSLIRDILAETQRGMYDALVLGRRGVSRLEEILGESTSRGVIHESTSTPVWVCRMPDPTRANVLLYIDGSEQGFRMADHAGFILSKDQDHDVTILSVLEPGNDPESIAPVQGRAANLLIENGVDPKRIAKRVENNAQAGRTIADIAQKEAFSVVAAGRVAPQNGLLGPFFADSISLSLFRNSGGATLWLAK